MCVLRPRCRHRCTVRPPADAARKDMEDRRRARIPLYSSPVVTITDIHLLRDGGTILFVIQDPPLLAGRYRLRTPFEGEPRPIFRDEVQLELGSKEEAALSRGLQRWLSSRLTPTVAAALQELDEFKRWPNLPDRLAQVVPLHQIRDVIRCLDGRREA